MRKNTLRMPEMTTYEQKKFWSMVRATANPNLCWEWGGGKNDKSYGTFTFKGKEYKAHRIAYYLHYGVDPLDKLCCHSCDNPGCSNPIHIFLGTDMDNNHDKIKKGRDRQLKGDEHPLRKLSSEDVVDIRVKYKNGFTGERLSIYYGVAESTIMRIIRGESWSHTFEGEKSIPQYSVGSRHGHAKLTEKDVLGIRADRVSGMNHREIAEKYGVGQPAITRIINRQRWQHI